MDDILRGGLPSRCLFLIAGQPGTGKTTLAMQFLLEGIKAGQRCMYVTLSESRAEIDQVAKSHDWNIAEIEIVELIASETNLSPDQQLTIFNPSEVDLGETTQALINRVKAFNPERLVIDSLSELRLVAQSSLRYRRQILALKQFFNTQKCTVLVLDDETGEAADGQIESIAHGVIRLEQMVNQYGSERRRIRVAKLRGVSFRGGFHDMIIRRGGLDVFPRLVAAEHLAPFDEVELPSGNVALDNLLGGGLPMGTSTLLLGPAGTGKSTIATQFAVAAARRGDRAALFIFDENIGIFRSRSRKLGMNVDEFMDSGQILVQQIDPAELSPGQFGAAVRRAVDGSPGVKVIVIDSLNGYLNAMSEERFLTAQLHELLAYLGQQGVATILTVTQSGMIGSSTRSPVDTTYLADNVLLFRYFESLGVVRRAISAVKKRNGKHETTIREMRTTENGIEIGEPLSGFQGILTGTPTFVGEQASLMKKATE